jgi:hypothetical protein
MAAIIAVVDQSAERGGSTGLGLGEARERDVTASARRRPNIATIELDPRVGCLIDCVRRQTDHEHRLISLLAQQPIEDERSDQAADLVTANAEASSDRVAEQLGWVVPPGGSRGAELASEPRQRRRLHGPPDSQV